MGKRNRTKAEETRRTSTTESADSCRDRRNVAVKGGQQQAEEIASRDRRDEGEEERKGSEEGKDEGKEVRKLEKRS